MHRAVSLWLQHVVHTVAFMDRTFDSAEKLMGALRAGEVTSVALTDAAIDRIERHDRDINAICVPAGQAAAGASAARASRQSRQWPGVGERKARSQPSQVWNGVTAVRGRVGEVRSWAWGSGGGGGG